MRPGQAIRTRLSTSVHGRTRSLRVVIVGAFGLIAVSFVIASVFELRTQHREIEARVMETGQLLAQQTVKAVVDFIEEIELAIRASTEGAIIAGSRLQTIAQDLQLANLLNVSPPIMSASLADGNGQEIARIARDRPLDETQLRDLSASVPYQRALSGQSYRSQPYFVRESEPYITISIPIWRTGTELVALVIAEVTLRPLTEVLADAMPGTAVPYMVASNGDLIAHPDISLVLRHRNVSELSVVQNALSSVPAAPIIETGLNEAAVVATHALVSDTGWAVIVERPATELTTPLRAADYRILTLMLIGLGLVAIAGLWVYKRFLRPARILAASAVKVQKGHYVERIEMATSDEFADIAAALNHTTARLGDFHSLLTDQVRRRTSEITEALNAVLTFSRSSTAFQSDRGEVGAALPAAEAALLLQRAITEGSISDPALTSSLQAALCEALVKADRPQEAQEAFERAIEQAKPLGPSAELPALFAILSARGFPELMLVRLGAGRQALDLVGLVTFDVAQLDALCWHFADLVESGDLESAGRVIDVLADHDNVERGGPLVEVRAAHLRIVMALMRETGTEVEVQIDKARANGLRHGYADAIDAYCQQIATVRRAQGRPLDAGPALVELRQTEPDILVWGPLAAMLACDSGNHAGARDLFEQIAARGFDSIPPDDRRAASLGLLAEVAASLGDTARSRALFELLQPYQGRYVIGPAIFLGPADRYLGLLADVSDDTEGAERYLADAITMSEDQPIWRANAELDLARILLRRHDTERAAKLLDQSLETAKFHGQARLRDACLRLLSEQPREGPAADGLTAAELRVLRLLASGATNRNIGLQLHLSPNTVANHVRNILAKTGTGNRTEAANYAQRHNIAPIETPIAQSGSYAGSSRPRLH